MEDEIWHSAAGENFSKSGDGLESPEGSSSPPDYGSTSAPVTKPSIDVNGSSVTQGLAKFKVTKDYINFSNGS